MKFKIISIGSKAPGWVADGFNEYAKRLPKEMSVELVEIAAPKHHADNRFAQTEEGDRTLRRIADGDWVVALDEHGRQLCSQELARKLAEWRMQGTDVAFVIGGADGLADGVRDRANEAVSLSKMTFPHYMVRVILAEALYRAWSISAGHPYHRAR